jgi:hypothetical protein
MEAADAVQTNGFGVHPSGMRRALIAFFLREALAGLAAMSIATASLRSCLSVSPKLLTFARWLRLPGDEADGGSERR